MSDVNYREISLNGLWKNNPAIVQLLGLCPLLAVTGSVINAIGMGLATIFVLTVSNTCVSLIRNITSDAVRQPAFVMIIAAAVTCIELLMCNADQGDAQNEEQTYANRLTSGIHISANLNEM